MQYTGTITWLDWQPKSKEPMSRTALTATDDAGFLKGNFQFDHYTVATIGKFDCYIFLKHLDT